MLPQQELGNLLRERIPPSWSVLARVRLYCRGWVKTLHDSLLWNFCSLFFHYQFILYLNLNQILQIPG